MEFLLAHACKTTQQHMQVMDGSTYACCCVFAASAWAQHRNKACYYPQAMESTHQQVIGPPDTAATFRFVWVKSAMHRSSLHPQAELCTHVSVQKLTF